MQLEPGTTLGHYEILSSLGAGGMGEVYRAKDTKLGREVAVKLLLEEVSADAERLARFEREARVLASLNHNNIATLHGFEKEGDTSFLVMELVEGETLADRIKRGAIPVDEALPLFLQIAEGLEAAHAKGVIHRDLKPANIKVSKDGHVKILDFGLAKAMTPEAEEPAGGAMSMSPTLTLAATRRGEILGTAAYMSPEQAKGMPVDKRADVWSFGITLFEALTGQRSFEGDTAAEILAKVLEREPDWSLLPSETPPLLRRLLERCTRKKVKARLQDIGDVRLELAEIDEPLPAAATGAEREEPAGLGRLLTSAVPWALAAALAAALTASLAGTFGAADTLVPLRRFTLDLPWSEAPNWTDFDVAISPIGTHIAFNCRRGNTVSLCVRALDQLTVQSVTDGRDLIEWFFSPDGEWLGLSDGVSLSKISIRGGDPQTIHRWEDGEDVPSGFSWGEDGYILMGTASGVFRVSAAGGRPEQVTTVADGVVVSGHFAPSHLPDGRSALISIGRTDGAGSGGLVDLAQGTVQDLPFRGTGFVYAPTGHVVFRQGTTVLAAPFDLGDPGRVRDPLPVLEDVRSFARLASDGTLAYVPTRGESGARLVWVDRAGRPTPIAGERRNYSHLDLVPDGRRALLNLDGGVYLLDLDRGTRHLLAEGAAFPIWSRDGNGVTFARQGVGLMWESAEGSGASETLVTTARAAVPTSWNPVTGDLAYYDHVSYEIWIHPADGEPRRFLGAPGRKRSGRFSPDGKWLAYISDETGEYQVYVTSYPGPGPTTVMSVDGGMSPIWSPDGRELFFRRGGKVLSVRVTGGESLRAEAPVELFDGPYTLDLMGHQRWDVGPDAQSFLMVENSDDFPIVIVQNWFEELMGLVSID